jgi:hypothetical protein
MELATKVASEWIRRILVAKFSPEFYRTIMTRKFQHPETGNRVLFYSLPEAEQKKIHDQWAAGQGRPQVKIKRKDFTRMRDESKAREQGYDLEEEQAAAKADRKEMAQAIKQMKDRNVPARIIDKERRRFIQQMESNRLKRKKERDEAFAQAQTVAASWMASKVQVG